MKISYSQVEEYCNELHSLAKNMKETLENVRETGKKLSSSGRWVGSASNYYSEKLSNLTKDFDEIFKEVENSILFMASCSEGYNYIDKVVIREICSNLNITEPCLDTSKIFIR